MGEHLHGITDTGRQRQNNEDAFIAQTLGNGKFLLACVIDGVGGYEGGEVAAAIAKETIRTHLREVRQLDTGLLRHACMLANERICLEKQKKETLQHMACVLTLVLIDVKGGQCAYAHVGDTRLYLFRDGSLVKITRDHSFVGMLEDSNRLNESEAMQHPKRNEIDKALGFQQPLPDPEHYIEAGTLPFLSGDLLLLCSDGLTDMITRDEIVSVLRTDESLDRKAELLVNKANDAGGKDNITVVLARNRKSQKQAAPLVRKGARDAAPGPVPVAATNTAVKQKRGRGRTLGFSVAGISLLLLFLFLLWPKKEKSPEPPVRVNDAPLLLLKDTLPFSADSLVLAASIFGDTLLVQDTLWIEQDSLFIGGTGNSVISSDGPTAALQVAPSVQQVTFADLQLSGIDLRYSHANAARILFKNVRLRNVRLGIGVQQLIRDTVVNGSYIPSNLPKK